MIRVIGLTPAWQRILIFDHLHPGEVNRAAEVYECASGKILNVGLALARLGDAPTRVITCLGGANRARIIVELSAAGVDVFAVTTEAATRVCTTLLDQSTGITTELVENAAPLTPEELQLLMLSAADPTEPVDVAVITGSLPTGCPVETYPRLLPAQAQHTICDIQGPGLLTILPTRPTVIKPNRTELAATVGRELPDTDSLRAACRELQARGARNILVSDGPRPAHLVTESNELYIFHPPHLDRVVNPIGCGDCLTAGIACSLARGDDLTTAIITGLSTAAANALELLPARWNAEHLSILRKKIRCERRD